MGPLAHEAHKKKCNNQKESWWYNFFESNNSEAFIFANLNLRVEYGFDKALQLCGRMVEAFILEIKVCWFKSNQNCWLTNKETGVNSSGW